MHKISSLLLLSCLTLTACGEEQPQEKREYATVADGKGGVVRVRTDKGERVQITDKDGQNTTVSTVAEDVKLPAFAPAYPGAKPQEGRAGLVTENEKGRVTEATYITSDSPEQVADYYKSTLKKNGAAVSAMGSGDNYTISSGSSAGSARINVRRQAGVTRIVISATEKPKSGKKSPS